MNDDLFAFIAMIKALLLETCAGGISPQDNPQPSSPAVLTRLAEIKPSRHCTD